MLSGNDARAECSPMTFKSTWHRRVRGRGPWYGLRVFAMSRPRARWLAVVLTTAATAAACSESAGPSTVPCGTPTDAGAPDDRLRQCEQHYQSTRDPRSAAVASDLLRRRGREAWLASRYTQALDAMDQAIRHAEAASDQVVRGKALRGMFTLLLELGDFPRASRILDEIRGSKTPLDRRAQTLLTFDQGLLEEARDQPRSARSAFEAVLKSPALLQVPELDWTATMNLLALSLRANDLTSATGYADQIEGLFKAATYKGRSRSRVSRAYYRAQLELLRKQPAQALAMLDEIAGEKPPAQMAWKLAFERGRARHTLQRPEARRDYEQAIEIIEAMQEVEFDDFRSWIVAARLAPYLALFDWHRERGDAKAALHVVERTQGRMFLDALGAAASATPTQQPRDVVTRLEWMRRFYPALRASPVLGQAPPIDSLLRDLADRELLVFFEAEEVLYLVRVHGGQPRLHRAPESLPSIRRRLSALLGTKGASSPDRATADALAKALFPDDLVLPPPGSALDVVLSPSVARLPLVSLPYRGQSLLRRLTLVHAPSLTALAALRKRPAQASGPSLVLADAQLDLPGAAREAEGVQSLLGGPTKAPLKLGTEATASQLLGAKSARVIHLALHSDVSPAGPFLRLHDRPLYAGDVLAARLESNLVVLASCASSVSLDPGLWGSIVVAFLAGGASSVLGTLWSVDDAASRQFVLDFYRAGGANDAAGALARVQRDWMSRQRPLTEWGAFVLFGRASR